ncbi:MAG: hypothetical protein ACPHLK_04775, partial [Gammaproteobacteria bacterium]
MKKTDILLTSCFPVAMAIKILNKTIAVASLNKLSPCNIMRILYMRNSSGALGGASKKDAEVIVVDVFSLPRGRCS